MSRSTEEQTLVDNWTLYLYKQPHHNARNAEVRVPWDSNTRIEHNTMHLLRTSDASTR
jgi:hypothetical protein